MGSQNPKHNKKKVLLSRQQVFESSGHNYRYIAMVLIFIAAIGGIIALVIYINKNQSPETDPMLLVQDEDVVKVEYKLWADENRDNKIDWEKTEPNEHKTIEQNMTKDKVPCKGFYNNVIGMKLGEKKRFFLKANVDVDGDGIDDNTGDPIESYGNPSAQFYNMSLVFWVDILNITKAANNIPESTTQTSSVNEMSNFGSIFITNKYLFELIG
jgi:hypothetical protein